MVSLHLKTGPQLAELILPLRRSSPLRARSSYVDDNHGREQYGRSGVAPMRCREWELAIGKGRNGDHKESTGRVEGASATLSQWHFARLHF